MASTRQRFTWQEMRRYWQIHSSRWSKIDYHRDPDGLGNVCYPGAPLWLNQHYARFQKMVYQKLFMLIPPPIAGARALDVGCGAGRWCRFLNERGYDTVGIDLQPELIEINRNRYPDTRFSCTSIQDYFTEEPFDLVSTVTVVQHIPFDEQDVVFQKLRGFLRVNGYAIMLESIHYQTPHVFSNTIKEWQARAEKAGFHCMAILRYDYSPFLRLRSWMAQRLMLILRRSHLNDTALTPETFVASSTGGHRNFFSSLNKTATRLALGLDTIMEPILINSNIALPARHCGFLFKAI